MTIAGFAYLYPWTKALHVIAVIAWMAGLLYLPRLYVYHCEVPRGSAESERFKVMERRLLKAIMTPAMLATWVLGLVLAYQGGWFKAGWLHGKLVLVFAMTAAHGMLASGVRRFAADQNTRTTRYWRVFNEVPTVLTIGGDVRPLTPLAGGVAITSTGGERDLWVVTSAGRLVGRAGSQWVDSGPATDLAVAAG